MNFLPYLGFYLLAIFFMDSHPHKFRFVSSIVLFSLVIPSMNAIGELNYSMFWIIQLAVFLWFKGLYSLRERDHFSSALIFLVSFFIVGHFAQVFQSNQSLQIALILQVIFLSLPFYIDIRGGVRDSSDWFVISLQLLLARTFLIFFITTNTVFFQNLNLFSSWGTIVLSMAGFSLFWLFLNRSRGNNSLMYELFLSYLILYLAMLPLENGPLLGLIIAFSQFLVGFDYCAKRIQLKRNYVLSSIQRGGVGSLSGILGIYGIYIFSNKIPSIEAFIWLMLLTGYSVVGWLHVIEKADGVESQSRETHVEFKLLGQVIAVVIFLSSVYLEKI